MSEPSFSLQGYDFADFGCSSGSSMKFAQGKLGGGRGVGLDINAAKVEASRAAGFDAHVADVTKLDASVLGTARFVVMSHFLEHLPNTAIAAQCINSAVKVADEFVLIRQPFFDADDYLQALELRLYWSHWVGHRNHMKTRDFRNALDPLLAAQKINRYVLFSRSKIVDSSDPAVHPISSPVDQHAFDSTKHAPKPYFRFRLPVYREVGALITTRAKAASELPRRFLLSCEILHDSKKAEETQA